MSKGIDFSKIVGQVIREIRLSKNLSQEKMAELGEFERSYISKVENAERKIQLETFVRLALALEMKPSELLQVVEERVYFK